MSQKDSDSAGGKAKRIRYSGGDVFALSGSQPNLKGALRLSRQQIMQIQLTRIRKWENKREIWPFIQPFIWSPGLIAGLSGIFINAHYRRVFRITRFANPFTYAAASLMPFCITSFFHYEFVGGPLLCGTVQCPTCLHVRLSTIQLLSGFVYPILLTAVQTIASVRRHVTYSIQPLSRLSEDVNLLKLVSKPLKSRLMLNIVFQMVYCNVYLYKAREKYFEHLHIGPTPDMVEQLGEEDTTNERS